MWHVGFVNHLLLLGCSCHLIFASLLALVRRDTFEDFVQKICDKKHTPCICWLRASVSHPLCPSSSQFERLYLTKNPDIGSNLSRLDLTVTCAGALHLWPTLLAQSLQVRITSAVPGFKYAFHTDTMMLVLHPSLCGTNWAESHGGLCMSSQRLDR